MANTKIPPHNDEAEQSVLGAMMIDKEAITLVSGMLTPAHFYNDTNALIYDTMLTLFEDRKPIDILTLTAALKKKKAEDSAPPAYLTELVSAVPTAANVEYYAQIVKDMALKRSLIRIGGDITEMAFTPDSETKDILDKAESSIFTISQGNITRDFVPLRETLADTFDRIDALHQNGDSLRGVRTGFADLDHILSGMQKSNLLILAARPGTGKTAITLNMAQYVAMHEKKAVAIFSLEMSKEELVDRLVVAQSEVDAWKIKTGRLNEDDWDKVSAAMGQLGDTPLFIDDTPGLTMGEMRSKARRLHLEHNLGLIVVDYLQLVNPGKQYESRTVEVSAISQGLKNLARELNVPMLACSQLSRAVEQRGEKRPQLADLRESGAIEQDADVVMFIYRPDNDASGTTIPTKLLISKHRNGATGEIDLLFRGDRMKFYSVEHRPVEE
jgi:replicative DNA helicase